MELKRFEFSNGTNVRIIPLMTNETSWFVASDVCNILGLSDTRRAVERLEEDEKQIKKIFDNGQSRDVWLISESGLYTLIFSSTKNEAKSFRKWVTSDVLPQIRKSGRYTTEKEKERQLKMRLLSNEIDRLDEKIEVSKKETKKLLGTKELKQNELRLFITADDSQLDISFTDAEQV